MFHFYLYEIKNNLNGKIYVGVHKTKNLDDGYMGSGKLIGRAIEKYGLENFTKTILEKFDDAESMYAREKEYVNEDFLMREDVYNLRRGGHGGFDYLIRSGQHRSVFNVGVPLTQEHKDKIQKTKKERFEVGLYADMQKMFSERAKNDNPMHRDEVRDKVSKSLTGKQKTEEHKKKISDSLMGKNLGRSYPNRKKREPVVWQILECPHCGATGKSIGMRRWHFDKCKHLAGLS